MVSKTVRADPKTVGTITIGTDATKFPKIVFLADGTYEVATTSAEQTTIVAAAAASDVVWESVTNPTTVVSETPYGLVLGRDFGVCVFSNAPTETIVVGKKVPAPVLNPAASVVAGNANLSWTNSFGLSTKVYRTEKYTTGSPLTSFSLISTVSGNPLPDTPTTYIDTSVTLANSTESVSYFVVNKNGQSSTVVFTGPA